MSHELRTPLNAILGFSHLLGERLKDSKEHDQLHQLDNAARHLLSLVNDILDYARIDAGDLVLVSERFDPVAEVSGVISLLTQAANDKQLSLRLELAGQDIPEKL